MQHLRILLSSFGEEDFQMFALNLLCHIVFGKYFTNNVVGATILTNFNYTYPRHICVISKNCVKQFVEKKIFKGLH